MIQPVFPDNNANGGAMIGLLVSNLAFDSFVAHLLPRGVTGITAVLKNTCGQAYSYTLDGQMVRVCAVVV
jgi:hypothetical protein